jgi:DNA replication protein DnaC
LAIALAVQTAERGQRVYFTTAQDLAVKLSKAVAGNRLHRALMALNQPKVLVLDEVGYLRLDGVQASLIFQVICQRYQKGQPIVLTSNKSFSEWGSVFGDDAVLASGAGTKSRNKLGERVCWRVSPADWEAVPCVAESLAP